MARIGLSIYLMFATLAGPWLCCCAPQRLRAPFALRPTKEQGQPPAHSQGSCCCHQQPARCPEPEVPADRPRDPDKRDHPCPCGESRPQAVALVSAGHGSSDLFSSRHALQASADGLPVFLPAAWLSRGPVDQVPREAVILPFLTSQDILCALHILRC